MFRKPGDNKLYMLCSGQDGFGPNPINLFSAVLPAVTSAANSTVGGYTWPAPLAFSCLGNPFSASANGFNTQPFQVLPNPYDDAHAVYLGDNWLHGPGKDFSSPGACSTPGQPHGDQQCEPWQGNCPCGWPHGTCPGTSSPHDNAGYVMLSFSWGMLGNTDYLLCGHGTWNMKAPPKEGGSCYTFDIFPDPEHTPGFQTLLDYEGKQVPYIVSSCGFAQCPGWPLTKEENEDPDCCKKLGDALTQAKYNGVCQRDTLCGGTCKETYFGNIPGGGGQCTRPKFDASKASLFGSKDCAAARLPWGKRGSVLDACRGQHHIPSSLDADFQYTFT